MQESPLATVPLGHVVQIGIVVVDRIVVVFDEVGHTMMYCGHATPF
jgi:hypothetical protein